MEYTSVTVLFEHAYNHVITLKEYTSVTVLFEHEYNHVISRMAMQSREDVVIKFIS